MQPRIFITPSGHLRVEDGLAMGPPVEEAASDSLRRAFGESSAAGLLLLATNELDQELPTDFVFWRGFARDFFQHVCQLGDAPIEKWVELKEPADDELAKLVAGAPPMRGLEYLSADRLRDLWHELRALAVERATAHRAGPAAWLQTINPLLRLLGRVTFHLAENKRDPNRPFAFLARLAACTKRYANVRNRTFMVSHFSAVGLCRSYRRCISTFIAFRFMHRVAREWPCWKRRKLPLARRVPLSQPKKALDHAASHRAAKGPGQEPLLHRDLPMPATAKADRLVLGHVDRKAHAEPRHKRR